MERALRCRDQGRRSKHCRVQPRQPEYELPRCRRSAGRGAASGRDRSRVCRRGAVRAPDRHHRHALGLVSTLRGSPPNSAGSMTGSPVVRWSSGIIHPTRPCTGSGSCRPDSSQPITVPHSMRRRRRSRCSGRWPAFSRRRSITSMPRFHAASCVSAVSDQDGPAPARPADGLHRSSHSGERQHHLAALAAHHKRLAVWAENCPENFLNRAALVGAEIARLDGRELDAERLYEQAIHSARASGFIHNEAVAYETAARFYAERGLNEIAQLYLRNARYGYLRWGADGKVRQLRRHVSAARQRRIATRFDEHDRHAGRPSRPRDSHQGVADDLS